jgi:hypothetical protein
VKDPYFVYVRNVFFGSRCRRKDADQKTTATKSSDRRDNLPYLERSGGPVTPEAIYNTFGGTLILYHTVEITYAENIQSHLRSERKDPIVKWFLFREWSLNFFSGGMKINMESHCGNSEWTLFKTVLRMW